MDTPLIIKEIRVGNCCDTPILFVHASQFQTYAECKNCECRCLHPKQDDGDTTCWKHHDCSDGSCTHGE